MLRAAISRRAYAPCILVRAVPHPQCLAAAGFVLGARIQTRYAHDKPPDKVIFPGSQSPTAPPTPPIKPNTPASPASTTIPSENVPKLPPSPQKVQIAPPTSIPPPTPPPAAAALAAPPPPPRKKRRFRRFFFFSLATLGLAYGGAVYYALISDNFHDFFVERIPWGEDAVLFFEEREFKRRFPGGSGPNSRLYPQVSGENKVTISGGSGASVRITDKKPVDLGTGGKQSISNDTKAKKTEAKTTEAKSDKEGKTTVKVDTEKPKESKPEPASKNDAKEPEKKPAASAAPLSTEKKSSSPPSEETIKAKPASSEPAASSAPIPLIDSLNVENASDPVVQKVSKMLNDVIAVINADNASGKYSSALAKAKDDLKSLAGDLETYRGMEAKAAEERIKQTETEFDQAATNYVSRVEQAQKEQEMRWREEYEAERERLAQTYDDKLKAEIEAAQKVADQKLHNELLEQDITLQKAFASSVRERVESERDARLSKLEELSATISELENLTGQWNEVVDANLKTQHLVVAVDAVRAALENIDKPTPFVQELAALREVAHNDRVIDAAIASIHPSAYQRGLPTPAQLIDRFRRVAAEVRKAALLPEDAGVASHAASLFLSKFMFKKQGLALGEDVESILTRTEMLLEGGDLDEATREMNGLTGWAKVLSQDWLKDCRTVLEVKQALEVIVTEAKLQSLTLE